MGCPTVKIKSEVPGIDYFVINEEDFDISRHKLYKAEEPAPAEELAPAEEPTLRWGRK